MEPQAGPAWQRFRGARIAGAGEQLDVRPLAELAPDLDDLRAAFAEAEVDHVIMGAGIDLETRLAIVREIFRRSDKTTVHLKDRASGPEGFLPFARAVLRGLQGGRQA